MNRSTISLDPLRRFGLAAGFALSALAAGCVVAPARQARAYPPPPPPDAPYASPVPVVDDVVSVYVDPPISQPPPLAIGWAPPPLLVEAPPPMPFADAVWIGGSWAWQGDWVWAAGRWAPPPRPDYRWVQPYYEHRGDAVVYVGGFWSPPGVAFVPPPASLSLSLTVGGHRGPPPLGPQGVFIPPPPGSRPGLIVPAPIGTAPAVLTSAPPVTRVGMSVSARFEIGGGASMNGSGRPGNNVMINAPASATANGRPFESTVPAQAHLAAGLAPVVHAVAPTPRDSRPLPSYLPGRGTVALPAAQPVRRDGAPAAASPAQRAENDRGPASTERQDRQPQRADPRPEQRFEPRQEPRAAAAGPAEREGPRARADDARPRASADAERERAEQARREEERRRKPDDRDRKDDERRE